MITNFEINKTDLPETRFSSLPSPNITDGQVELEISKFSLSANNITYALFGELMQYWDLFGDQQTSPDFSPIPVWGIGEVIASKAAGVDIGSRYYALFPSSSHRVAMACNVNKAGFSDGSGIRPELTPIYSEYAALSTDPYYTASDESGFLLFRPIFRSSLFLEDWIRDQGFFGAEQLAISSASGKTAISFAYACRRAIENDVKLIGLTSRSNESFVSGLGLYDEVLSYEVLGDITSSKPTSLIDMSGNMSVRLSLQAQLGHNLKCIVAVGATHWDKIDAAGEALLNARLEHYWAPAQMQKRVEEWGVQRFEEIVLTAWCDIVPKAMAAIPQVRTFDEHSITTAYRSVLTGNAQPDQCYIGSMRR